MINPSRGVFFGNRFSHRKIDLAKLVGHQWPTHGCDHLVILEQISQFAASGPHLADVRFQFQEFLLDRFQLFVAEVIELGGVRFVIPQDLRRHVHGRKIIPH